MSYKYTFTVFTPTFNRSQTLHRVYESLKAQTFKDFEWLVVDDGSKDGTGELIKKWQAEANFPVRYVYQENQGKHAAFNHGVKLAQGELLLVLDSDDGCVPETLERFNYHWNNIPLSERKQFFAVTVLCKDQHGKLIGDKFPMDIMDSNSLEIRYKYKVKGEKWEFRKTDVLRQFPFPVFKDVKYIPEGIIWSAMDCKYKTRFANEILRIYWNDETGNTNQLTRDNFSMIAFGCALLHKTILNNQIGWFFHNPKEFLRSAAHYVRFSLHTRQNAIQQYKKLNNLPARILWLISFGIGWLVYIKDSSQQRRRR